MGAMDWNDLRHFLAVAESGSTLAAARSLRVSQTTVARRIAALEEALAVELFDRRQAGYALTEAGESLLPAAREVQRSAQAFADAAASQHREAGGTVRLTTWDLYAVTILVPLLRELHERHPAIRIEVDSSETVRDLAAGAADIALRVSDNPHGGGLVGRRIATDDWAVYCSRAYAESKGVPRTHDALRGHALIGGGGEAIWRYYREWLAAFELEDAVVMHHGSVPGLLAAVRGGLGIAALPCFIADREPDLVRCMPPARGETRGIWLLTHERLRRTPRIRAVLDFLGERLAGHPASG